MRLEDKDTSSGRDMRTYCCDTCKKEQIVDNGVALWQVLHDAREREEAAKSAPPVADALRKGRAWHERPVLRTLHALAMKLFYRR